MSLDRIVGCELVRGYNKDIGNKTVKNKGDEFD